MPTTADSTIGSLVCSVGEDASIAPLVFESSFRMTKTSDVRVGVDTGGTFIDVVVFDPSEGRASATKVASDRGMAAGLRAGGRFVKRRPGAVVAGTTRVTNAVLEGKLARTALLATRGFADVLTIGRQARDDLYDLNRPARVPPPVPRELCIEVRERLAADGTELVALSDDEVDRVASAVETAEVDAVAICLLHSYANGEHEARLAAALGGVEALSVSHEVSRERREFERASTTALNAAVMPVMARYVREYESAVGAHFADASSFVVHSSGGMMPPERARSLPLATVMSGPAAGVAATARLARRLDLGRAVSLDMGGTSTDVCLLRDAVPTTGRERRLAGYTIRLPAVAVESVGAGGGSIAWVDDVGALRVGPRSAGADPGPAAYGRGGEEATVTDAAVVLGTAGSFFPGVLELDEALAREACGRVGSRLGLSADEAARAVVAVAHAELERALRLVTVRRGHDLRECVLVAYGGAGPMHAGAVALKAGVDRVVVPPFSSTFSALGCCLSELAIEEVRTHLAGVTAAAWPGIRDALEDLLAETAGRLDGGVRTVRAACALELRYRGQNDELEIPVAGEDTSAAVIAAFHDRHRREFGYATEEPVEMTAIRARLWADEGTSWAAPGDAAAEPSLDETVFGRVFSRGSLEAGRPFHGPALLVDHLSTVVVWPDQVARADEDGSIWLERDA
jgi:N-methylhydantoinase A